MTATLLRWLERALLVVGIVLALWCADVLYLAHRTANMPVPPPASRKASADARLPGDVGASRQPAVGAGEWLARLDAPTVRMHATVLEGSDDATLARGAGHIEDTAFPGDRGNFGVAGHRDTTFRPLRFVRIGDPMTVTTRDRVFHYRVESTAIVGPDDVYVLDDAGHPTMTLVTCYPFEFIGHAPRRFIVRANLIGSEERVAPPN